MASPTSTNSSEAARATAATLALGATLVLTLGKFAVALLTGSVGVLSEALHSALDLVSAGIAFFTVREAGKPADVDHPFGHGKFETLSSLIESLLLIIAAGVILYEAWDHIQNPRELAHADIAIVTMLVSLGISYYVYRQNSRVGLETESLAIQANAMHFLADVLTSLGVLVGLVLIRVTGLMVWDVIIAVGIAIYITLIAYKQSKNALSELLDSKLPESEQREIQETIKAHLGDALEAHDLRTRKSGARRHVDFHLIVCGKVSVNDSHARCDEIESALLKLFREISVTIHVEPCSEVSYDCAHACPLLKNPR